MEKKRFYELLGGIVSNLQSLEFSLRAILYKEKGETNLTGVNLSNLQENQTLPENSITNWDKLRELIEKYNEIASKNQKQLLNKIELIRLRDAIAHGRVSSQNIDDDLELLKFSKPEKNLVKVEFAEKLTESWLEEKVNLVGDEILKLSSDNFLVLDSFTI
jgi:hypothetical protein